MSSLLLALLLQTNSRVNIGKHHSPPLPSIFLSVPLIFVLRETEERSENEEGRGRKYAYTDTVETHGGNLTLHRSRLAFIPTQSYPLTRTQRRKKGQKSEKWQSKKLRFKKISFYYRSFSVIILSISQSNLFSHIPLQAQGVALAESKLNSLDRLLVHYRPL